MGCSILPAHEVIEATEVEVCAEWGVTRVCTHTLLLPNIHVTPTKMSLLNQPSVFTIYGHPHALRAVKVTTSPGLKIDLNSKSDNEITVSIKSEPNTCGYGWVNVVSRLTAQDVKVEVSRECDQTCRTLLAAIFMFIKPYLATLVTLASIAVGSVYGKFLDLQF